MAFMASLPLLSGGGRGIPRISESFFWTSMIVSAWRSLAASRWFSRLSRSFSAIKGASGLAFGPRRLGVSPASVPSSRCCRHVLRCDEYRPSRRSRAPSWPGSVQRSASRRMRSLYSAVNRRRTGFSGTAGSGIGFPLPAAGAPGPRRRWWAELQSGYALLPFRPPPPLPFPTSLLSPSVLYLLALYCNNQGGSCLTYYWHGGDGRVKNMNRLGQISDVTTGQFARFEEHVAGIGEVQSGSIARERLCNRCRIPSPSWKRYCRPRKPAANSWLNCAGRTVMSALAAVTRASGTQAVAA